jgi:hypothetical protein
MHSHLFKPYQKFLGCLNCVYNKASRTCCNG